MQFNREVHGFLNRKMVGILALVFLAGCAGNAVLPPNSEYVEIENPGLTMSPNAPATIWVPRKDVEKGIPRGGDLMKRGYNAVMGTGATGNQPAPPAGAVAAAPAAAAEVAAQAPSAPPSAPLPAVSGPGGKIAHIVPHFGLVAAVDGERVFFNLGRETGIAQGQKLKVYRGGTVIEGLGLAPGEQVATVEVVGFVGTRGGYGVVKQGGPVQANDLIGAE